MFGRKETNIERIDRAQGAQVATTLSFIPDTLFYTVGRRIRLSGELYMGDNHVGESNCYEFTREEVETIHEIVQRAVKRQHERLQEQGNL